MLISLGKRRNPAKVGFSSVSWYTSILYWYVSGYVTLQCYNVNVLCGTDVCWDLENKQYTGTDKIILLTTNTQLSDSLPSSHQTSSLNYSSRNLTLNLSPTTAWENIHLYIIYVSQSFGLNR